MKLISTYSLGAIATIFSATQALTGNDLITLADGQDTGIIWNSDKSLCLKMSGNVFDDELNDSPASPGGKKNKMKDTCEGVSASFSVDCADMINSGNFTENNLPLEYQFRISEHPNLDDRFCIISSCDDGLNESGSVYKLQWNGPKKPKKKLGKKAVFGLESFGGNSTNTLEEYFQFDESNYLTYGSINSNKTYNQVVWRKENDYALQLKAPEKVDRYDSFLESKCESDMSAVIDSTTAEYEPTTDLTTSSPIIDPNNNPTEYTLCGDIKNGLLSVVDGHKDKYFEDYGFSNFRDEHLENNEILVNKFPATIKTPGYPGSMIDFVHEGTDDQFSCHAKVKAENLPDGYVYRVKINDIDLEDYNIMNSDGRYDGYDECSTNLLAIEDQQICKMDESWSNYGPPTSGYYYFRPSDISTDATLDLIGFAFSDHYYFGQYSTGHMYRFSITIDLIPEVDIPDDAVIGQVRTANPRSISVGAQNKRENERAKKNKRS